MHTKSPRYARSGGSPVLRQSDVHVQAQEVDTSRGQQPHRDGLPNMMHTACTDIAEDGKLSSPSPKFEPLRKFGGRGEENNKKKNIFEDDISKGIFDSRQGGILYFTCTPSCEGVTRRCYP